MSATVMAKDSEDSYPRILLASDSEHHGEATQGVLQAAGYETRYAGLYDGLGLWLASDEFDLVLIEVTSVTAVEPAVAAALRVKRVRANQFVGYLADSTLHTAGLAGDGIFPRNGELARALGKFFSEPPYRL